MTKKIAVFPGSFDPVTKGHENIVKRALPLFDEIIVAIGINSTKQYYFPLEKRMQFIEQTFAGEQKVKVMSYSGLTIEFCKQVGSSYILRGLRSQADFEFEKGIAQMNKAMEDKIETIFILSTPALSAINSTIIRDILKHGGDVSAFVPEGLRVK
jgi:pantetheine-phosphate adenylyltransferase